MKLSEESKKANYGKEILTDYSHYKEISKRRYVLLSVIRTLSSFMDLKYKKKIISYESFRAITEQSKRAEQYCRLCILAINTLDERKRTILMLCYINIEDDPLHVREVVNLKERQFFNIKKQALIEFADLFINSLHKGDD